MKKKNPQQMSNALKSLTKTSKKLTLKDLQKIKGGRQNASKSPYAGPRGTNSEGWELEGYIECDAAGGAVNKK